MWYNIREGDDHMNPKSTNKQTAGLVVSENVIAKIAGVAALEVRGVANLTPITSDFKGIAKRSLEAKAVRVKSLDSAMVIDIAIIVAPVVKLSEVCKNVQRSVKTSVQNMVGRPVARVNVLVKNIATAKVQ